VPQTVNVTTKTAAIPATAARADANWRDEPLRSEPNERALRRTRLGGRPAAPTLICLRRRARGWSSVPGPKIRRSLRQAREVRARSDGATIRPDAEEAKQMTRGRLALVDGTLWPCWSWERAPEMWAGKYKTTGHGSLIIGDEFGNIIFVSDPAPG
jgi:hypothetical protein